MEAKVGCFTFYLFINITYYKGNNSFFFVQVNTYLITFWTLQKFQNTNKEF
jgi:hypothetical protein